MYPISPTVRRKFIETTTTSLTNGSDSTITGNVATTALSQTVDNGGIGATANNVILIADNDVVPIESNNVIRKRCSSADLYVYDRFPIYEQNNNNNSNNNNNCSMVIDQSTNDDAEGNCNTIDEEEYAVDINNDTNDTTLLLESDTLQTSEGCIVSLLPGIHEFMPNDTLSHEIDGYTRPYFLYSQVIKGNDTTTKVGISFYNKRTRISRYRFVSIIVIAHIAEDGLFGKSNNNCLVVGDEIIAVNNLPATTMNSYQVAKLLRTATGTISLTVRDPTGDPRLLFSSIQKPSPDSMVGLALSNKCFGNTLYITKVEPYGLFASSLLMPGQRCLMINGISCRNLPSPEAVKLIHRRVHNNDTDVVNDHDTIVPHHVSFITKVSTKAFDYASVLSSDDNMNIPYGKKILQNMIRLPIFISSSGSGRNRSNNRDGGQTIIAIATAVESSSSNNNTSSNSTSSDRRRNPSRIRRRHQL